uniref:Putative secreted protein n=1 Tax=Ixodes ricinus TaxID=34613 RepID=A0A6B0TUQ9_IXORI
MHSLIFSLLPLKGGTLVLELCYFLAKLSETAQACSDFSADFKYQLFFLINMLVLRIQWNLVNLKPRGTKTLFGSCKV